MKRSFYALFVLLAAISGPLVVAPKAISRQDAVSSTTESPQADDPSSSDDADAPRSQQEPNQPKCVFSFDFGEAPEDLIVLPEDFDYEIYGATDLCEIEQIAAKPASQKDTQVEFPPEDLDQWPDLATEPGEALCLPFAELDSSWQPWEGPAIAGVEPDISIEEIECELAVARFREEQLALETVTNLQVTAWITSLLEKTTYSFSSMLSGAAIFSVNGAVNGAQHLEDLEGKMAYAAFGLLNRSASLATGKASSVITELLQVFDSKRVVAYGSSYPIPPYCDCWANPREQSESLSEHDPTEIVNDTVLDSAIATDEGNRLEFDATSSESSAMAETLPKSSEIMQNDAAAMGSTDFMANPNNLPEVDFQFVRDAVEQVWGVIQEKAQTLERLSKDYDFEPLSPNQVEELRNSP